MSRLIDADALIENLRNDVTGKNLIRLYNLNGFINAQPTVDAVPVVHGHWRRGKSYPHHIFCSNCYRTYVPNDEIEMWKDDTRLPRKYCPECGALMDEVTES